jgi:SAM-dependent methyltransferase
MGWYEDADAYDRAFDFPPDREIRFLDAIFRRAGLGPGTHILEPMVGTGRLLPGLTALGYRLLGFDASPAMLARARTRCPDALLFRARAERLALAAGSAGGAHCLIDSFRYIREAVGASAFVDAVAHALRPGAPFLVGLDLAGPGEEQPESWSTTRGGTRTEVRLERRPGPSQDLEWMEVLVRIEGPAPRTVRSRTLQRRWTPEAFCRFLDGCRGFSVAGIWRRGEDPDRALDGLPRSGGPVVVALLRESTHP